MTDDQPPAPSLSRSLLVGAVGFGLASLVVFGTVAYAELWMYRTLGIGGAYTAWTVLFILLGSVALLPLVRDPARRRTFPVLFTGAFLAYSVAWVAAYFALRGTSGEWAGSLLGSVALAVAFALGFRVLGRSPLFSVVLFVTNSAGYFLGSLVNNAIPRPTGMLLWGLLYGIFLGAGLGIVLYQAQETKPPNS